MDKAFLNQPLWDVTANHVHRYDIALTSLVIYTSKMKIAVKPAKLLKRYKRFLADIELANGKVTTIHCANTGAMTGCAQPGDTIWYSTSTNPKRKYPLSWELTHTRDDHLICVNTMRANQLVEEALQLSWIKELANYPTLKREVKYGNENSKIDFFLTTQEQNSAFVEVKSATLIDQENQAAYQTGRGYFPDAVTTRGQKHLRELTLLRQQGQRTLLLFTALHSGINSISPAKHIDPDYTKLFWRAQKCGVEILAYKAEFFLTTGYVDIALKKAISITTN